MKTNKLVKILAVSAIFTSSVAMFAACGSDKHELTLIGEQAATCTTDGHKAYYMCSHCDSIFEDAEGKIETSLEAVKINMLGHDLSKHDAEEATCTKDGNIEYYTCSREEGKYFTANGEELATVVTTKDHDWSDGGVHEYVQPTVDNEGMEAYWECKDCHNIYADPNGDKQTTLNDLKIDRVKENLDGVLTENFYNTENAYAVGNGGLGFVINGRKETDGLYLHIVANYNTSADLQTGDHGKIGLLFNFRNQENLNLPGALGVCLEQTIYMELYLSGRIAYNNVNTVEYFKTVTNTEESGPKYSTTWELFLSYADLSKANGGKLAEAFEVVNGKIALKQSYAPMLTAVGNMTYAKDDQFEADDSSKCDKKDYDTWLMWYKEGYGDWGTDQKYMALGKDGFFASIPRAVDTYTVTKNDVQNATVSVPETVDWNESISGKVTVTDGYVLSGIKVNGKVVVTKGQPTSGNEYQYDISVASLGLKWYETQIALEFVVTKLEYEDITFTLRGVAGGQISNIAAGTEVVLMNEFGDEYKTTVGANGVVSVQNVLCQNYAVKVADYIDGSIDVVKGETPDTVTLEYYFAHNAGTRPDLVDLTDMNAANPSITLGAQGENGVDENLIAAQIKLSDEMKNAPAYVLYTTVKVNGEIQNGKGGWLQRFAIRFAEGDENNSNNKFVVWWDDLGNNATPSAIWANELTNCGGAQDRQATYDWLASDIIDGLQLKVVRNGGNVAISVYSIDDEKWYPLLSGTTSESAKNDITFIVSGESFTFSDISFEALEVVPLSLPQGTTNGVKEHLTAQNGDVFALSGVLTSLNALTIPYDSLAYSDYDNVNITDDTITIKGNGISDRNSHSYNNASYILPEEVVGEKQVSLTFNVKDTYSPEGGDHWAARRFGIQIGKGAYGVYFWTSDSENFELNHFVVGTLDMNTDQDGQGIATVAWAAGLIRSANGLDVQIVRLGNNIVVNFRNADGEWVKVGETACDNETEVKFVGGGDTWVVSQIAMGKLEHKNAVDPSEENGYEGNVEYYTDGTHYYLADGSVATHEEVKVKQVAVTLGATAKELDGTTNVTLANGTQIVLTGRYKNYTYTVGGANNPEEMLAGTYEAYLYGYGAAQVVVPDNGGAVEIVLVKTIAYGYRETVVDDGTGTIKITGIGCPSDGTPWSGYAEIVTDQTNADKVFEFVVKDTNIRNGAYDFAARRIAIQVAGNSGFFFWFNSASEVCVRHLISGNIGVNGAAQGGAYEGDIISTNQGWMKGIVENQNGEGLKFRILRNGTKIVLCVYNGTQWIKIGETTCGAEDKTNLVFYAQGDDYVFSGIKVEDVTVTTVPAKAPTTSAEGNVAYYTDGTLYYLEDGTITSAEGVVIPKLVEQTIEITVKGYKDGVETLLNGTLSASAQNAPSFSETLADGKATVSGYVVTYTLSVEGYVAKEFTVEQGKTEYEIVLEYEYATATYAPEQVDLSKMNSENHEIKLIGDKGEWDNWDAPVPEATLTLPADLANSNNISVEFTLKAENQGHWRAPAFGIAMTENYNGFVFQFEGFDLMNARIYQMHGRKLLENYENLGTQQGEYAFVEQMMLNGGVRLRAVRNGTTLTLYGYDGSEWQTLGSVTCEENDISDIKLMGNGCDFTVSDITVSEYTAPEVDTEAAE